MNVNDDDGGDTHKLVVSLCGPLSTHFMKAAIENDMRLELLNHVGQSIDALLMLFEQKRRSNSPKIPFNAIERECIRRVAGYYTHELMRSEIPLLAFKYEFKPINPKL